MTSGSLYEKKLAPLENIVHRLEQGTPVQVTALMPLRRLLSKERVPLFMEYLVERTLFHIRSGSSLSLSDYPASEEKAEWFEQLLSLLAKYRHEDGDSAFMKELRNIEAYCESHSQRWTRPWVHATRKIFDDVDLLLM